MDDKSLPQKDIVKPAEPQLADGLSSDRRAFFRRAVVVGIPVVLATVRGRPVYAQSGSACASLEASGCVDNLVQPVTDIGGSTKDKSKKKP